MAFQLAKAYVEFSQKGMGGIMGGIGSLAGKLKSLVSPMGLVTAGLGALGAGAGIGGMLKLAADTESLATQFRVLLGSGEAAAAMMREIEQFAAETPFEQMELGTAAKGLLGYGTAAKDLIPTMRRLGDISALSGASLQDLVAIYGKIGSKGKAEMEAINQLQERGIPITRELAAVMGIAESEVSDYVSKGKVGFGDVQKAIARLTDEGGQYAGGMAELAKTSGGLWSTVTGNLKTLLAQFGAGIMEAFRLKDVLATVGTWLDSAASGFQSSFGPAIAWMQSAVGSLTGWIGGKFSELTAWVKSLWAEWGEVVWAYVDMSKAYFMMWFEIVSSIYRTVYDAYVAVFSAMSELLGSWVGQSAGQLKDGVMGWLEAFEFFFLNWKLYLQIGWEEFKLFVTNIPAYFRIGVQKMYNSVVWFVNNWQSLLWKGVDYVLTIFINLGQKIRDMWQAVLDFFGGASYEVNVKPIMEGYKHAMKTVAKAGIQESTPELDRLYKELDKRKTEFYAKKRAGKGSPAEGTEEVKPGETPAPAAPGVPGAPGKPGGGGGTENKFKFYGLAAFADQMQQAAAKQAESRQTMDLQRQQADATTRLADAAAGGGLKVTVTNAADLQPAY